jgi:hypothetical protein
MKPNTIGLTLKDFITLVETAVTFNDDNADYLTVTIYAFVLGMAKASGHPIEDKEYMWKVTNRLAETAKPMIEKRIAEITRKPVVEQEAEAATEDGISSEDLL